MQVYALESEDFCEDNYHLIGIHSTLDDYKLAYLLNKYLDAKFYKSNQDLEFVRDKEKVSFSIYDYENINYDFVWSLIANSYLRKNKEKSEQLLLVSEETIYLIPEKKKVDYFLKVCGRTEYSVVIEVIKKIKNIENVITAYSIDKNSLKSKDFLIF